MNDEIVKGLRTCTAVNGSCEVCPYDDPDDALCECANRVSKDAADAIEYLQTENAALQRQIDNLTSANAVVVKEFETKLEELEQVKAEHSWLSVKDRLPEEDGRYLVTECVGNILFMSVAKYTHNYDGLEEHLLGKAIWYDCDSEYGDFEKTGITHWMPLPDPPEKEA